MNFKKFISGISALTIAAGAFAAMAVTASAETTYDTLGEWGITNPAKRVVCTATAVAADGNEEAYTRIDISGSTGGSGVYNGSAHKGSANGTGSGATRSSGTRVATQDIRFHHDSGNNIAEYIGTIYKSAANYRGFDAVATIQYAASGEESDATGTLTLIAGKTSDKVSITEGVWYSLTVTAEYDSTNAAVTIALADAVGTNVKTVTGSASNKDIDTFAASAPDKKATTGYFDAKNESIGTVAPSAGTVTVSLKDGNGASLADDIVYDVSDKLLGDSFTYYYPAYIEKNGTLYKSDVNVYGVLVSLLTAADTYEVTYTATGYSVYKFKEFDATSVDGVASVTATAFSNGALTGGGSGEKLETFTIDEDGVYTAIVNAGCVKSDNSRTGGLFVNNEQVKAVTYTNYNGTLNTFEGLSLKAGDVITVSIPRNGYQGLDYVLFYKTAKAQIDATNEGAFTSDEDETETATAFLANTNNVSGNVDITITPSDETVEAKTFSGATTLTDATAVFGIIVNGLYDAAATAVVTIK